MGLLDLLRRMFGGGGGDADGGHGDVGAQPISPARFDMVDLARRLEMPVEQIRNTTIRYDEFTIPKRAGGSRKIAAPDKALKEVQRRILRRVLGRLRCHPCCMGFQPGLSIVHNALPHAGKAVVLRMDVKDFFASTSTRRIEAYFRRIGWDGEAAGLLTGLCTHNGGLPQGAPTSPRLSNLVNFRMDARLAGLGAGFGAAYTRYADDITFSFATDRRGQICGVIGSTKKILAESGYRLHQDKKLRVCRRGGRQLVTGLVVNDGVRLPRRTRRWLRAVRHHAETARSATLTDQQLAGWEALEKMVRQQA